MTARFSRQILVPNIGIEGQARIQNATFRVTSAEGTLREQILRLYAERAGLRESIDPENAETSALISPFQLSLSEFFQEAGCSAIALGAADALNAINNALDNTGESSVQSAVKAES